MRLIKTSVRPVSNIAGEPFDSVEEAWSWAVAGASARLAGARTTAGLARINRPCEPFDIIRLAWKLYGQQQLSRQQVRALLGQDCFSESFDGGELEESDYHFFDEALDILINPLQKKGILL